MSVVVMLMIFGWTTFIGMIGFHALKESGKLLKIRRRLALWVDDTLVSEIDRTAKEALLRGVANIR